MLHIDEKQLRLLLEERKKFLERPRYEGLGDFGYFYDDHFNPFGFQ